MMENMIESECLSKVDKMRKCSDSHNRSKAVKAPRKDGSEKDEPKRSKKQRMDELEGIHAESQRLLRETVGAAFAPEPVVAKTVTSILEKIRRRKLQVAERVSTSSASTAANIATMQPAEIRQLNESIFVDVSKDGADAELDMDQTLSSLKEKQDIGLPGTYVRQAEQIADSAAPIGSVQGVAVPGYRSPATPEPVPDQGFCKSNSEISTVGQSNPISNSEAVKPSRPRLIESQDLYSDSQLSAETGELGLGGEDERPGLDVEIRDDDQNRCNEADKENMHPPRRQPVQPVVSHVRRLIDDEAEDEDEDLLGDEDEDDDTGEDLENLIVTNDEGNEDADNKRRAELHTKWLEQQDTNMTEDILQRIKVGWGSQSCKSRIPGFLDEDNATNNPYSCTPIVDASNSQVEARAENVEVIEDGFGGLEKCISLHRIAGGSLKPHAQNNSQEDLQELSDDDEAEEKRRRQLILEESEEHMDFMSVTEDESSREVFRLINKVNVSTTKTRMGQGQTELRTGSARSHASLKTAKPSFLGRISSTVQQSTTRTGSGNSRSFVFGRDDSNHSNSCPSIDALEEKACGNLDVSNECSPTVGRDSYSFSSVSTKSGGQSATKSNLPLVPGGLSLFEILRQQAADLDRALQGKGPMSAFKASNAKLDNLSIFAPSKSLKSSRSSSFGSSRK